MSKSFLQTLSAIIQHNEIGCQKPLVAIKQNQIRVSMASMDANKAYNIYKQLQHRSEKVDRRSNKRNWRVQQLRFAFYLIDKFCFINRRSLEELTEQDWSQLASMIPGRQSPQLKFKILSLTRYSLNQYPWSEEQQRIFLKIVGQEGLKWDNVSKILHQKTQNKVFRNSKQCRQHYLCFLNPRMKKGAWSDQEDYFLLTLYIKYGRKWAKMSRIISGRNQNAIKNRFFLLIQNKCKKQCSFVKLNQQKSQALIEKYLIEAKSIQSKIEGKIGQQKTELIFKQIVRREQQLGYKQSIDNGNDYKSQLDGQGCSQQGQRKYIENSIFLQMEQEQQKQDGQVQHMNSEQFLNLLTF